MDEKEEWETIDVSNEEIPYEIEEETEESSPKPEPEPEVVASEKIVEEAPQELEGINTKGAEKRIRQLVKQRKERDEQILQLLHANEQLSHTLQSKDREVNSIAKQSLEASERQLTDKMDLARAVYMEAFEEGDKEKVLKAQEMLNDAQADLKTVHMYKAGNKEKERQVPAEAARSEPSSSYDPMARDWASENEWFGTDNIMTAAALAIDHQLKDEGYNPNDSEFYQEIDNRLQEAFPQKFGEVQERVQENTVEPAQVVSGASRSSPNSSRKVKLSKEDVRLAQKWGIPLEHYAAEKLKVSNADGEYTNIN